MSKFTAAQSAAASTNVSFKRHISPDDLIGIFRGEVDWHSWLPHISVFFTVLPEVLIQRFMDENGLPLARLSDVYEALPSVLQGGTFENMRNETMGRAFQ
jgi:hypothetical protein